MADILKGLVGAGGAFVLAWVLPCAIALASVYVTVLRPLGLDAVLGIERLAAAEQALVLSLASTALAVVMNALSTPLYRILEGYAWPTPLQDWGKARQRRRRQELQKRAQSASPGLDQALAYEQLKRFPLDDGETAPTRLGNALRTFETYALDRYRLNSQLLWTQLVSVAPDTLRAELESARSSVDFFVASSYLSALVGSLAAITAVISRQVENIAMWGVAVIGFVLARLSYRSAVSSSSYWDATVRALVDLGRAPLAKSLGLRLPPTIEAERAMWDLVSAFAFYAFDPSWASNLDDYRSNEGGVQVVAERTGTVLRESAEPAHDGRREPRGDQRRRRRTQDAIPPDGVRARPRSKPAK